MEELKNLPLIRQLPTRFHLMKWTGERLYTFVPDGKTTKGKKAHGVKL
jgi:hypothetical protein